MSTKIFVGNLPFCVHEDDLAQCFGRFGEVTSIRLDVDPETGRSRRRCLVEMADEDAAQEAIEALDGKEFQGRTLVVNEVNPHRSSSRTKRRSFVYRRPEPTVVWPPVNFFHK